MGQQTNNPQVKVTNIIWDLVEKDSKNPRVNRNLKDEELDKILREEMNALPVGERQRYYEEIHGVSSLTEETPDLVANALAELEEELSKIPEKPEYDRALQLNANYVQDVKFRLKFLRADLWEAKASAARMVMYFRKMKQHFGEALMVRPLTQNDLTKEDLKALKTPTYAHLPTRDRSGRLVNGWFPFCGTPFDAGTGVVRAKIYSMLNSMEDEDTQKRGVVQLAWYFGTMPPRGELRSDIVQEIKEFPDWLPYRVAAYHLCIDDTPMKRLLANAVGAIMDKRSRRVKIDHFGTPTEVMYRLMTFGVPVESLPLAPDGSLKQGIMKKYIKKMKAKEDFERSNPGTPFVKIELPLGHDVLLGKGKVNQFHEGTTNLRLLVEEHRDQYMGLNNSDKGKLTWTLVKQIKEKGRFLKKDADDWWILVPDEEARRKVSKAMTDACARRKSKPMMSAPTSIATQFVAPSQPPSSKKMRASIDEPNQPLPCFGLCGGGSDNLDDLIWGKNFQPFES